MLSAMDSVPFVVDAKGGCFMCLQQIHYHHAGSGGAGSSSSSSPPPILSLKLLTRYLKVEFERVFDISSPLLVSPLLKDRELGVPLCEQCVTIFGQFTLWYRQLELVRLKVEGTVRKIAEVMVSADRDRNVVCQYSSRTIRNSVGPQDLVAATISDKLRKEVAEKASNLPKRSSPKVELNELDGKLIPTGFQLPTTRPAPGASPHPPPLATAIKGRAPRNKNSTKNDAHKKEEAVKGNPIQELVPPIITTTPDLPVVITETVVTRDQIKFRKLANGKYQCGLCSKVVPRGSIPRHKSIHSGTQSSKSSLLSKQRGSNHRSLQSGTGTRRGQRLLQCKHCNAPAVWETHHHNMQYHLFTFFTKYQDPRIVLEQFEKVVETLFSNLAEEICQRGSHKYTCAFCDCLPKRCLRDAHSHMIGNHMDDLIPRLMSLQQAAVMDPAPIAIVPNPKRKTKMRKGSGVLARKAAASLHNRPRRPTTTTAVDSGSKKFPCAHCDQGYDIERSLKGHTFRKHIGVYFNQYNKSHIEDKIFNELVLKMFRELDVPKTGDNMFICGRCKGSVQQHFKYRESVHKHYVDCHMEELGRELESLLKHPEAMMMGMGSGRLETEIEGFGGSEDEESIPIPIPHAHDEDEDVELIKMEDSEDCDADADMFEVAPMDFLEVVVSDVQNQQEQSSSSLKQEYYCDSSDAKRLKASVSSLHQSSNQDDDDMRERRDPLTSGQGTNTLQQPKVEEIVMIEARDTSGESQQSNDKRDMESSSATVLLADLDSILGI